MHVLAGIAADNAHVRKIAFGLVHAREESRNRYRICKMYKPWDFKDERINNILSIV